MHTRKCVVDFERVLGQFRVGNVTPDVKRLDFEFAWNVAIKVELAFTAGGNSVAGDISIARIERNKALNWEAQDIIPATVILASPFAAGRHVVSFTFVNGMEGFALTSTLDIVLNQVSVRVFETPGVVAGVNRVLSLEGSRQ